MRRITLFKGIPRINVPVQMTKKAQQMFPRGPHTGTLVRKAQDGRYVIRRDNRATVEYWHPSMWRRIAKTVVEGEG